ncbi:MAG: hypothetical protein J6Y65_02090 [Eggerthellaceae bacterium]|nr:hypothetical protein [Eggerthellaceae bacterium]
MKAYLAHYRSPNASGRRAMGVFEFESSARLNSKQLEKDARMAMLSQYGNEALSWIIEDIEIRKSQTNLADGQLKLDFREPIKPKRNIGKKDYR